MPHGEREPLERQVPLGRVGGPLDIAYDALFLASDESSFTTGSGLVIYGEITAVGC